MMWSKFARNGILVGQVEAYCLVCRCLLSTEELAAAHLHELAHTRQLEAVGFYDKYKHDCIRKVKDGYFCGMCNTLLSTAARVGLHVAEASHVNNRGALLLSRSGESTGGIGGVLAHGNILLQDDAWHGLVDETCVICNAEFDAKDAHKSEPTHTLKLVQSKVLFGAEKRVYRKIDETLYQCLTCNIVVSAASFNDHFGSTDHETAYKQSEITNGTGNSAAILRSSNTDTANALNLNKPNGDVKIPIDNIQSEAIQESCITSEVEAININDTSCKSIAQHLDNQQHEIRLKLQTENAEELAQEEQKIINKNDIENNIQTKTKAEEAAEIKYDIEDATKTIEKTEEVIKTSKRSEEATKTNKDTEETPKTLIESVHMKEESKEIVYITLNRSQILDSLSTFQQNEVNINLVNDTAICKKCSKNVDFDYNAINKHIAGHKKSIKKEDKKMPFDHGAEANGSNINLFTKPVFKTQNKESTSTTSIEDIKAVAKKHGMMYNGRELHCTACDSTLPVNLKNIEEHVSGNKHKAKMSQPVMKQVPKKEITKQPIELFIQDTKIFDENNCKEFVINEKYCLPFLSLLFIGNAYNELSCIACNVKLSSAPMVDGHVNSLSHQKILEECSVITSLDSEFVREMRPGVYHCGFCNAAVGDWKGLEKHLNTSAHKRSKARSEKRLRLHMANVRANKTKPGVYNCSFCNYVASDWDTLNAHFSTPEHVTTKIREEWRVKMLMGGISDPSMRERMDHDMFEMFKGPKAPNFCESDDSD